MAKGPTSVEIRAYQVGFGDCFLLSFIYTEKDKRHVLIDFGTTGLPKRGKPAVKSSQYMPLVAQDIARVCGANGLTAVVATHRHADHVSGYGTDDGTGKTGEIIKSLEPRVVLQPWTEDPNAARDATKATRDSNRSPKSFTAGLRDKQAIAQMIFDLAASRPVWMSASLQRELSFLGMENIANPSAIKNLIAMGEAKGAKAVWAHHGSRSGLERLLPGVTVHVLGPPDLTQTESIRKQRKTDPDQFWHLLGGTTTNTTNPLASGLSRGRAKKSSSSVPVEARWFRNRLQSLRGSQLLEIVRTLDDEMNNTSLILLFEVFGKKLLFPGDAQIENWSYALVEAPTAAKTRALLAGVDVYKVGHHGSLNATPKKLLWEGFTKRGPAKQLKTVLSTMPGKHGKVANKTEVPRRTLLAALESESDLASTMDLSFAEKTLQICKLVTVTPEGA
jgi:beta-lactamase superfamily II metal-dependent hydrolase